MPEEDDDTDSNTWQLRFENGELVRRPPGRIPGENDHTTEPIEPAEIDGGVWTFDVGANLYGALGESILTESPKPHALRYFVLEDLAESGVEPERGLNLEITRGVPASVDRGGGTDRWIPDCIIVAKDGRHGRVLER